MPTSSLSERASRELLSFAWEEWAQMGVLATPRRESPWAQDPEALIVFTLEVARDDPRLFDEVLDWMLVNESLLGGWRLRALCTAPEDAELVAGALSWVARHGGRDRAISRRPAASAAARRPLFRGLRTQISKPDEAFAEQGLLRPVASPSGKSQPRDMRAPINLAFRLRHLLGVTARAEAVRCLLTIEASRVTTGVVAREVGLSPRNVGEALTALHGAGVVSMTRVGAERYYAIDRARWAAFLDLDEGGLPAHRDWPQLLSAMRRIARFLADPEVDSLSEYLRASRARDLLEDVHVDLTYAGVPVELGRTVDDAWDALATTIDRALKALQPPAAWRGARDPGAPPLGRDGVTGRSTLEVYAELSGAHRWRLKAGNGQVVAVSPGSFSSQREARDAARQFADRAPELATEIHRGAGGAPGWRVHAPNGELIATSPHPFATPSNARRAAESARRVARDALRR